MNPRENLLSLYRRTGYEFCPVEFSLCPSLQAQMVAAIGADVTPAQYFDYPQGFARVDIAGPPRRPAPPVDWRQYYPTELHPDTTFGAYGVARERGYAGTHHLHRMHHPLAHCDSLEQLQAYPWPQWQFEQIEDVQAAVAATHAQGLTAWGAMSCTIWETAWYIRDMTQLMLDMVMEDAKATYLLDRVTEDARQRAVAFARAGVDIIQLGDDIGMQNSIMMSLEMYRQWLKPRLASVIAAAKRENPEVLIFYHSCGYVEPYIPDLIEIGIDILNPIQPECMDFAKLHAQYGDRLSFNGSIGTQTTMPFGTPEDVRHTVTRNLDVAGARGGLLPCPTHLLEPEVPWANVEAYVRACKHYTPR